MSAWYCKFLIQYRRYPDNYIIVLLPQWGPGFGFDHDPNKTKVFFVTDASSENSKIEEIQSESALKDLDGEFISIKTESGIIWFSDSDKDLFKINDNEAYDEPIQIFDHNETIEQIPSIKKFLETL